MPKKVMWAIAMGLSLVYSGSSRAQSAPPISPMPISASAASAAVEGQGLKSDSSLEQVIVWARGPADNLQDVPVSASVFNGSDLESRGVSNTMDLQSVVPGVIFDGLGSDANTTFAIRGQGRDVIGPGLPSVLSYLNEVPMPSWGSVLPTYDVSSVQVLKGPQGTLFGRNTTGGAVLVYTNSPSYRFGGYARISGGDYNYGEFEGAVNLPLIDHKLAIRMAIDVEHRDGYTDTHIVDPGVDDVGYVLRQDDLNSKAVRVSILWEPMPGLTNTLVADYYGSLTNSIAMHPLTLTGQTPWTNPQLEYLASFFGVYLPEAFACGTSVDCDVGLQIQRSQAGGPRQTWSDVVPFEDDRFWGISNTTVLNLNGVAAKNILGFRSTGLNQASNADGISLALVDNVRTNKYDGQFTEEFQLSGGTLGGKLNWLVGSFFLNDQPTGSTSLGLDVFQPNDPTAPPGYTLPSGLSPPPAGRAASLLPRSLYSSAILASIDLGQHPLLRPE